MRKRIYLFLGENFFNCFRGNPPWNMVDSSARTDLPMNLIGDNRFFIGNSWTRRIYGPFDQIAPQYNNEEGAPYATKEPGTPEVSHEICHLFTPFTRANENVRSNRGLPWQRVAEILNVHESAWLSLRALEMSDEQFDLLVLELEKANTDKTLDEIVVVHQDVEVDDYDFGEDDGDENITYADFIREHYGDDLSDEDIENIADSDDRD